MTRVTSQTDFASLVNQEDVDNSETRETTQCSCDVLVWQELSHELRRHVQF